MESNKQKDPRSQQKMQQQEGQVFEIRAHQSKLQDNPQQGTRVIESQSYRAQLKQPTGQPLQENTPQEKDSCQEKNLDQKKDIDQEKKPSQEKTVFQEKNISDENPCVEKEVKVIYKEKPVSEEIFQPPLQRQEARPIGTQFHAKPQEKLPMVPQSHEKQVQEIKPQEKKSYAPQASQKQPPAPEIYEKPSQTTDHKPSLQENRAHLTPLHEDRLASLKEKDFHETPVQEKYRHEMPSQEKQNECQDKCQEQYQSKSQDQGSQQPQGTILFTQMYQAKLHPQQGGNQSNQLGGMQLPNMGSQGLGSMMSNLSISNSWTQPLPDAQGAIIGKPNYDREAAKQDAMRLLKAMKGAGTDEATIVEISGNRTFAQRQMIVNEYSQIDPNEKRDLLQDLKSEISGDLQRLVLPLYMMPGEFDARLMEKAMYGLKNDVDLLNEVLCTRTNKEIEDMKNAWNAKIDSKQRLDERVGDETKKLIGLTNFHILCLKLLEAKRPPCTKPDEKQVRTDAEELNHQLLDCTNIDTAKAKFVEIFTERSWAHIGSVVGEFQNISQKWTMDAAIGHEFGDNSNTTKALRVMADFCFQPYDFWAKKLRDALQGMGTDDSVLIRIIISRCEVDMTNIAKVFAQRYGDGKTLKSWIESDTSGYYSQLLLNLCGYY